MSREIDWKIYEKRKGEIQKQNLAPSEYERAVRELVDELERIDITPIR